MPVPRTNAVGVAARPLPRRPPARTQRRTRSSPAMWWVVAEALLLVGGSVYLLLHRPNSIDLPRCLLAIAIIWLGLVPGIVYLHLLPHRPAVPIFPLVGIFYATNYGLPIFAGDLQDYDQSAFLSIGSVTLTSLRLALIGIACMLVAYYASWQPCWAGLKKIRIAGDWTATKFRVPLWVCILLHMLYWVVPILRSVPSLTHLLDPLGYLAFGMFFFLAKRKLLPTVELLVVWAVLFPVELVFRLATGSVAQTVTFGIFLGLISFRYARNFSIAFVALAAAFFLIFNPVKAYYRMLTADPSNSGYGVEGAFARVNLFFVLAYDYYFDETSQIYQTNQTKTVADMAGRLSCISILSMVIEETPAYVPYWQGETYKPLMTKWIPRVVWPDKPNDDTGQQFGHRYHLLEERDEATSINLPWMVEMYANFGAAGLVAGMTLVGTMLAGLEQFLNRWSNNPIETNFGTTILINFIYQESSFSLMVGDSILLFISIAILLKITLPKGSSTRLD